jgi:hypothetical protein
MPVQEARDDAVWRDDMAECNAATLETGFTRYVEGGGIGFACRQPGPWIGTPLGLLRDFSDNKA